ncbi:MAG: hypothetical protein M1834_006624 [Cirrosporium novae-zelandiae]|nr:MAG: hypothetical protein M1834_006624 [Cirrosporium novae-zelandiae]
MASTIASGKGKGDTGSGNNWAAKHAQLASQGQLYIPEYQNLGMVSAMPPAVGVPQGPSQGKRPRVEDTFPDNKATSRAKRKRTSQAAVTMTLSKDNAIDPTVKLAPPDVPKPPKKGSKKAEIATPEKRLRRVRKQPPKSFLERLDRATTQRMFVIDRNRGGTNEEPEETFQIAGTTGNIYSITIGKLPSCTCPDNEKGNQCKHIIYALHHILKAPEHLEYQLALTSLELREIFEHAPFVPISKVSSDGKSSDRKPVEGLCPICYIDYDIATDEIGSSFAAFSVVLLGKAMRKQSRKRRRKVPSDQRGTLTLRQSLGFLDSETPQLTIQFGQGNSRGGMESGKVPDRDLAAETWLVRGRSYSYKIVVPIDQEGIGGWHL